MEAESAAIEAAAAAGAALRLSNQALKRLNPKFTNGVTTIATQVKWMVTWCGEERREGLRWWWRRQRRR